MKRNRLTLKSVSEVSLVDAGDNRHAHVVIHKRASDVPAVPEPAAPPAPTAKTAAPGWMPTFIAKLFGKSEAEVEKAWDEATSFSELEQQRRMRAAISETYDLCYLWQESVSSILRDTDVTDKAARIITSTAEFSSAVTAAASRWAKGETTDDVEKMIAKAGRAMSASRLSRLKEAHTTLSAILAEVDPTPATTEEPVADTTVDKNQAPAANAAGEITEDVLKALPENVRKAFEGMQAAVVTATAAATAAQEIAKQERDLRETAEITKRFDRGGDLHGLPNSEQLVPQLLVLKRTAPETFAAFETTLKASAEAIRQGSLFAEIGKSGDTTPAAGGAVAKLQVKAEEIRKAQPTLSPEQALVKAMDDPANAEIVREYRNELTGGR